MKFLCQEGTPIVALLMTVMVIIGQGTMAAEENKKPTMEWVNQEVDHFNHQDNRTWKQVWKGKKFLCFYENYEKFS